MRLFESVRPSTSESIQPRRSGRKTRLVDPKDPELTAVEGDGLAVRGEVGANSREVVEGGLGLGEEQLHEAARGVVDEDEQDAAHASPLEPVMWRAVIWMSSPRHARRSLIRWSAGRRERRACHSPAEIINWRTLSTESRSPCSSVNTLVR